MFDKVQQSLICTRIPQSSSVPTQTIHCERRVCSPVPPTDGLKHTFFREADSIVLVLELNSRLRFTPVASVLTNTEPTSVLGLVLTPSWPLCHTLPLTLLNLPLSHPGTRLPKLNCKVRLMGNRPPNNIVVSDSTGTTPLSSF